MPTYQYACPDCDYEFETQQKFTDKPLKKCPRCGKRRIHRVITNVAVTFKGSGWYITDSKKADEAKGRGGTTKGASADGGTKADGETKETVTTSESTEKAEPSSSSDTGKSDTKSSKKDKPK